MENSGSNMKRVQSTSKCNTDGKVTTDGSQGDNQGAENVSWSVLAIKWQREYVAKEKRFIQTPLHSSASETAERGPMSQPQLSSTQVTPLSEQVEEILETFSDTPSHPEHVTTEIVPHKTPARDSAKMTSDTPLVPDFALPLALLNGPEHPVTKMMERCEAKFLERQRKAAAIEHWKEQGVKFHNWMITEEWISQFEACLGSGCKRCVDEVIKASYRQNTDADAQPARKHRVNSYISDQHRGIKAQSNYTSLTNYERRCAAYSRFRTKSTCEPQPDSALHPAAPACPGLVQASDGMQFLEPPELAPNPAQPDVTEQDWLIDLSSDTEDDDKLEESDGNSLEQTVKPAEKEVLLGIENYRMANSDY